MAVEFKDAKVWTGSEWLALVRDADAALPIATNDGSILLGQAIEGQYDALDVVEGTQFVIVINEATRLKLDQEGQLSLFSNAATTFFNQTDALACFAKFDSSRAGCFVGTDSYSPFVVKDAAGSTNLIQVTSVLDFQCPNNIRTTNGQFQGQAWTTVSAAENDPVIKLDSSLKMIEFESAGVDVMHVADKYIQAFVDIRCDSIVGADDPEIDARIDLGEKFVVAKGDHTERFSINVQSGAIKQTTAAYTAFVIDGSNATGALIRTSCGASTYNFGATNLGWLVMDNVFNPLLTVSDIDIKAQNNYVPQGPSSLVTRKFLEENGASGELPISSEDSSVTLNSPKKDEFEVSLAGEMKLRITENDIQAESGYEGLSDNSLITRAMLYGHGGGGTPIAPPGTGSGVSWQDVAYPDPTGFDRPVETVAANGIFSTGRSWSANGFDWFDVGPTATAVNGLGPFPLSVSDGMYMTGNYFSYDMKNWAAARRGVFTAPFFWKGYFFCSSTGGPITNNGTNTGSGSWSPGTRPGYGRTVSVERPIDYAANAYRIFRASTVDWEIPVYEWSIKPLAANDVDTNKRSFTAIFHCASKLDGNMTLASQEMNDNNYLDKRVCYIAENPTITEAKPWKFEFVQVPGLTEIQGTQLQGIAYDEAQDRWVVLTEQNSYMCQGNPVTSTWRKSPLPNMGKWKNNFHFNGEKFIIVSASANSNLCQFSIDGLNWERSTDIKIASDDSVVCGTNGRSLLVTPWQQNTTAQPMQLTGALAIEGLNTSEVTSDKPCRCGSKR